MQSVLIVVHLIIVLALVGVVLIQRSEGGGLGMGGGGGGGVSGFMTGRGQTNVLTRTTAILATLFFITSLALSVMAGMKQGTRSIFDGNAPAQPAGGTPAPGGGAGVFDQLKRMQDGQNPQTAPQTPAVPAKPAAPQVPTQQ